MFPKFANALTPVDINFLVEFPFSAGSPLALSNDLRAEEVAEVPFFKFFIQFLKDLKAAQPLPLTQKGNLNRKFILQLYDHRILPSKYVDDKTINILQEMDWAPPHYSHLFGKLIGVIKKSRNKLSLTGKGEKLLENTPSLYIGLLQAFTKQFNWSYLTYDSDWIAQHGWAYTMYLLLKNGDKELPSDWYAQKYLEAFPQFIEEFEDSAYLTAEDRLKSCFYGRFFGRFCDLFGLANIRDEKDNKSHLVKHFVKKSTLTDRVFRLPEY